MNEWALSDFQGQGYYTPPCLYLEKQNTKGCCLDFKMSPLQCTSIMVELFSLQLESLVFM